MLRKAKILTLDVVRKLVKSRFVTTVFKNFLLLKTKVNSALFSNSPVIVILSLGEDGHSYSAARAAKDLGLKVLLVSPKPVLQEMLFASELLTMDPLVEHKEILQKLQQRKVSAVVISIKHALLPAQVYISEKLGLVSCGEKSALCCNDKFAWRTALEEAGVLQPAFSDDYNAVSHLNVVQKPKRGTGSKGVALLAPGTDAMRERIPLGDRSVGEELYFEEYIDGEQFDVEGFSIDGVHTTLVVVKEKYENIDGSFPPKYFRFNPNREPAFLKQMNDTAHAVLNASGIVNGAWHVEMRYDGTNFLPLDFANRMGYERFVSRSSGTDFAKLHIASFVRSLNLKADIKPVPFLQFFAMTTDEAAEIRKIVRNHPSSVFDVATTPFPMSTVTYQGMIVLEAADDKEMEELTVGLNLVQ